MNGQAPPQPQQLRRVDHGDFLEDEDNYIEFEEDEEDDQTQQYIVEDEVIDVDSEGKAVDGVALPGRHEIINYHGDRLLEVFRQGGGLAEDEEDVYVDLDEDEAEAEERQHPIVETLDNNVNIRETTTAGGTSSWSYGNYLQNGLHPVQLHDTPSCFACQRRQTPRIRLFKWPKDFVMREEWARFFNIHRHPQYPSLLDHAYICSNHFEPEDFLFAGSAPNLKIFWSVHALPRYRTRRPCDRPFPWETALKQQQVLRAIRSAPGMAPKIHFRNSRFKLQGRNTHPVAVLTMRENPHIQYEFSLNRVSTIDGTKFYSCLHCRKAKMETKQKDNIRTIHLDGNRLLSKGDPLAGHHHSCRPLYVGSVEADEEQETEEGASGSALIYRNGTRSRVGSRFLPGSNYDNLGDNLVQNTRSEMDPTEQKIIYVDDPSSFCVNAVVEVADGQSPTAEKEEENTSGVIPVDVDGDGRWTDNNGSEYYLVDPGDLFSANIDGESKAPGSTDIKDGAEKGVDAENPCGAEDEERISPSPCTVISKRVKKRCMKGGTSHPSSNSRCPVCKRAQADLQTLVQHLQRHIDMMPSCKRCSNRIDPLSPFRLRKANLCMNCAPTTSQISAYP